MTASAPNVRWRLRADSSVVSPSLWLRARVVVDTKGATGHRVLGTAGCCRLAKAGRSRAIRRVQRGHSFRRQIPRRPPFGAGVSSRSPPRTQHDTLFDRQWPSVHCLGPTGRVFQPCVPRWCRRWFGFRRSQWSPRIGAKDQPRLPSLRPSIKRRSGRWARQPEDGSLPSSWQN